MMPKKVIEFELNEKEVVELIQNARDIDFQIELHINSERIDQVNLNYCKIKKLYITGWNAIPITLFDCECDEIYVSGALGVVSFRSLKKCEVIEFEAVSATSLKIEDSEIGRLVFLNKDNVGYIKEGEISSCIIKKEFIADVQMDFLSIRGKNKIHGFCCGDKVKHCSIFEGGDAIQSSIGGVSLDIGQDCSVFISKMHTDNMVCRLKGANSSLSIYDSIIKDLCFWPHKYLSFGDICIDNSCISGNFLINKGTIGKVYLGDLNLKHTQIDFKNSIESDLFSWDNVSWPTEVSNYLSVHYNDDGRKSIRSLKQKAKAIEDKFSVLLFSSLELKHKFESLRFKHWPPFLKSLLDMPALTRTKTVLIFVFLWVFNPFFDLMCVFFRRRVNFSIQDRLSLYISKYSNDFGMDWFRAILFTFCGAGFIFFLYGISLSPQLFVFGWNGWAEFWTIVNESFPYYAKFLNPTHDFDLILNYRVNAFASIWDFVGRIYTSFGYYQIIRAFRKFF